MEFLRSELCKSANLTQRAAVSHELCTHLYLRGGEAQPKTNTQVSIEKFFFLSVTTVLAAVLDFLAASMPEIAFRFHVYEQFLCSVCSHIPHFCTLCNSILYSKIQKQSFCQFHSYAQGFRSLYTSVRCQMQHFHSLCRSVGAAVCTSLHSCIHTMASQAL